MGSEQSKIRERELIRLEQEREQLHRAREEQEKEKILYRRAREDLEAQQVQEALRRSKAEARSQLYPDLNPVFRNETYQNAAAPSLAVNHDEFRFQPSAPPPPFVPSVHQQSETRAPPPPRPHPPTVQKPATENIITTTPRANTVRASVSTPQPASAAPQAAATPDKKVFKRKDDIMNCQTCKKPYEDKIFVCKNGHSACERCWSLDLPCGQCRGPVTNMRNFDLEKQIITNRKVKCSNAADGCRLTFKPSELAKHEKECPFKELKCPALGYCGWIGKPSLLSIHFKENHPSSMQANVGNEMVLPNICNEYNSLQLIKIGTYNFLFFVKVSELERKISMEIQLIGTKASASKWYYEIHVYNKREPRRKYLYVNSVHSSNESRGISLRNSAVLSLSYAMSFVNEGNLTYKIFIKKPLNDKQK